MSLVECTECHANISSKASACPTCGNPIESASPDSSAYSAVSATGKHGFFFYVGCIVVAAIVLFFGTAIVAGVMEGVHSQSVANDPRAIHADEEITLADDAFGCEFESKFAEAIEHLEKQEMSAWAKIVADEPYCFYGKPVVGKSWTVLQVRDNLMQISLMHFDEKLYKHDYWTLTKWGTKAVKR